MTDPLILVRHQDGVTTLTMNNPARLNGWTNEMLAELGKALTEAAEDTRTKALVLTGADPYYCAGVNLSGALRIAHPRQLHAMIVRRNEALFEMFLRFPKPILVAVNGPAIGASVTSATLCNAILASEKATFSTPFAALGVTPEGCSSEVFPRLIGSHADRMLGEEGWKPDAREALEIGLVQWVVPHEDLLSRAHEIALDWIGKGTSRAYPVGFTREELEEISAAESERLATAFLGPAFLEAQFRFLWRKKKYQLALMFLTLWVTRPVWGLLL